MPVLLLRKGYIEAVVRTYKNSLGDGVIFYSDAKKSCDSIESQLFETGFLERLSVSASTRTALSALASGTAATSVSTWALGHFTEFFF